MEGNKQTSKKKKKTKRRKKKNVKALCSSEPPYLTPFPFFFFFSFFFKCAFVELVKPSLPLAGFFFLSLCSLKKKKKRIGTSVEAKLPLSKIEEKKKRGVLGRQKQTNKQTNRKKKRKQKTKTGHRWFLCDHAF